MPRLLFEVGLGLEVWVANLVKSAGRPSLTVITTSKGIDLIPDDHEGEAGHEDVGAHPRGNPHVWLDPENAVTMMRHVTEALVKANPGHAQEFLQNQATFLKRLDQLRAELSRSPQQIERQALHRPPSGLAVLCKTIRLCHCRNHSNPIGQRAISNPASTFDHDDQKGEGQSRGLGNPAQSEAARAARKGNWRTCRRVDHASGRPAPDRHLSRHAPL